MSREVKKLWGKYKFKDKEFRLALKGDLTNAFVDDGQKSDFLKDKKDLKEGIKGIMFLSTNRQIWEVPQEPNIYNAEKDTVLIKNKDTIVEIKVDTLNKYFKRCKA